MYTSYFGFTEKPFSIAPNPRYLYMSERHREALAHLLYGMQGEGGVVLLTGEVGTGKTTVCRCMLSQIPDNTDIAFIVNPKLSALELLATVCDELHIKYKKPAKSIKTLTDLLNDHLLSSHANGRHTAVIIDEAQNLDADVLEQLRLLTNLETDEKKLLQIILLGQPELAEKLQKKELRQLSQRITARFHLTPLSRSEVRAYVEHRLAVAGNDSRTIFPSSVIDRLFRESDGIPRMINLIADRALLGAYAGNVKSVDRAILKQAVCEVLGERVRPDRNGTSLLPWSLPSTEKMLLPTLLVAVVLLLFNTLSTPKEGNTALPVNAIAGQQAVAKPTVPEPLPESIPEKALEEASQPIAAIPTPPIPTTGNMEAAFVPLFRAWDLNFDPEHDGPACDFARKYHLECLRQQGGIADMRSLDRPAVLTLAGDEGEVRYSAVLIMNGSDAVLANPDTSESIELSRIALLNRNDFTILWRTPPGYDGPVRPGRKGEIVQLLADKSAAAQNLQWIGGSHDTYDLMLKGQIKAFQRQQGLNPDGVAGPQTWIRINGLTATDIPLLHRLPQEQTGPNEQLDNSGGAG